MTYCGKDRRQSLALRNHVHALLLDGAIITSREPLQLSYKGCEISVRHGLLICEPTPLELAEALDVLAQGETEQRANALRTCLAQLNASLAPYPPFRPLRDHAHRQKMS